MRKYQPSNSCHNFIHDHMSLEEGIELGLLIRKT